MNEEVILKAKQGDNEAIAELIKSYEGELTNLARMYSKTNEDAKDAVQNTFIRMITQLSSLEDNSKFDAWIKQITVNEAKRIVMSSYNQKNTMFSDLDNEEENINYDPEDEKIENQPEMAYDKKETSEIVLSILDRLSEDQRIVALMHFYENKTLKEIAEELEIPQSTVIGRIQTAKKNIKASVLELENKEGIKLYNMAPLPFFVYLLHLSQGMPIPTSLIRAIPEVEVEPTPLKSEPTEVLKPQGEPEVLRPNVEVPNEEVPQVVESTEPNTPVETPKVEPEVTQPAEPIAQPTPQRRFDPMTGKPIVSKPEAPVRKFDPKTGKPIGTSIPAQTVAPVAPVVPVVAKATTSILPTVLKIVLGIALAISAVTGGVYLGRKLSQNNGTIGSSDTPESTNNPVAVNISRPSLIAPEILTVNAEYETNITDYELNADFSNVINQASVAYLADDIRSKLAQNYFVVVNEPNPYYEFFEIYESNMYGNIPSFITTDSILHTFHLYYAHLQKNVEKNYLNNQLLSMSQKLLAESKKQAEQLSGTEWESAAQRNVDYFTIGSSLSSGDTGSLTGNTKAEMDHILQASEIAVSNILTTSEFEYLQDYSQFKPRGYYTESEELEKYFRAMMWYGQMNFSSDNEELSRSALLINKAIQDAAYEEWNNIYLTTAFFAGESDDNGYFEYTPLIQTIYGNDISYDAIKDESNFKKYIERIKQLPKPAINSMVVYEHENRDEITTGYRVLGQRFTIDGSIMQRLVYRDLPENSKKEKRMMPDALDVPAALGSNRALEILQTTTNVNNWPDYTNNLEAVRNDVANLGDETWNASVSSSWLGTLRPLLNEDRTQYPKFMQNNAWLDKDLNTFLGNYTELKHDTVLYAKQVMSELGATGGMREKPDDRGYVEPQPMIYHKLSKLAIETAKALKERNLIADEDYTAMKNLSSISAQLASIAEKELRSELPTDEEFDFIRSYGGQLEHLWEITVDDGTQTYYRTEEHPAALVTDIATDAESQSCLQLGIGKPQTIIVAVYFDDDIRFTYGSVYSYYQFTQPISNRLTDDEWRGKVQANDVPELPTWTNSFYQKYDYYKGEQTPERLGYYGSAYIAKDGIVTKQSPSMQAEDATPAKKDYNYYVYEITEAEGYTWYRIGKNRWIRIEAEKDVNYWPV